jgi:hypothetical protein
MSTSLISHLGEVVTIALGCVTKIFLCLESKLLSIFGYYHAVFPIIRQIYQELEILFDPI